jgi:integrase
MATRNSRRHRGVVLMKPNRSGRTGWRARYVDPESPADAPRFKWESLPAELTTAEQREKWARNKARSLADRHIEVAMGAPRATGATLASVVGEYYQAHPKLRPRTVLAYKGATDKLLAWAEGKKLAGADDLTRAALLKFRASLQHDPKRVRAVGGKRGEVVATDKPRSAYSINRELRGVRTVLGWLVDADKFPRLKHDDLRRALKRTQVTKERIQYLKPHQLQKLLESCLRHDADTFELTREEAAGARPRGTTPKYTPIAAFTACVLLSGMRLGESVALDWRQVDLDALDETGRKVGELHLEGETIKTKMHRDVDLSVSPQLRALLAALQLKSGRVGSVFGVSRSEAEAAGKRLRAEYGAPEAFTWQALRRTCGTYLTNAPGVFGAASAYRSARQLGHSVQVAEKHYLGLVRGIPRDAHTLEAAMQLEDVMARVIAGVGGHSGIGARTLKAGSAG